MITRLRLHNFKSFRDATLELGHFSLLVGANASGKSNLRDAFRFLHGIGRGYTLAEIIGEKRMDGEKVWGGIRGGLRGLMFQDEDTFALRVTAEDTFYKFTYSIKVTLKSNGNIPQVEREKLDFTCSDRECKMESFQTFGPRVMANFNGQWTEFLNHQPVLSQCIDEQDVDNEMRLIATDVLNVLKSMRFLDPEPDAMRSPSFPGQTVLSDRGENLTSVLHAITNDPTQKETFIEWLHELTPMDASDFEFPADPAGRMMLTLVEANGQRTTAYGASDGTLRFLAMLAAMLGPQPSHFHFFEELEAGLHSTCLSLLLNLIEQRVGQGDMQVVATTHSPQLLLLVEPETLEHVSLTYRLDDQPDTRIKKLFDLPNARSLIESQDIGRLHESGWLEDAAACMDEEATESTTHV